eukprot:gene41557-55095_t
MTQKVETLQAKVHKARYERPERDLEPYEGEVHGAGQVSGIGIIHGREVLIHADDPSIKGGAWYPLSVKKIAPPPADQAPVAPKFVAEELYGVIP